MEAITIFREYKPGEIYIIPVRFSECKIPSIEIDATRTLDRIQYVDLFPLNQRREKIKLIVEAIKSTVPELHELDNKTQKEDDSSRQQIEITIDRDFDAYTKVEQMQFLRAIGEFLKMPSSEIRVTRMQRGSVKLTLDLPQDKAKALLTAIKSGQFRIYGAEDAVLMSLSIDERVAFLRGVQLFKDIGDNDLEHIATVAIERQFRPQQLIAAQGDVVDVMYVIVEGEFAAVIVGEDGVEREIGRRKRGEYIGERAIIEGERQIASMIAVGDVLALCLDRDQFQEIMARRPATSLAIIQQLREMVQATAQKHPASIHPPESEGN